MTIVSFVSGTILKILLMSFYIIGTVSPAQSSHFATNAPNNKTEIIPLHEQPLYKEDWIGLKGLEQKGGLRLEHCPGEHMDLGGEKGCGEIMVRKWVGWV